MKAFSKTGFITAVLLLAAGAAVAQTAPSAATMPAGHPNIDQLMQLTAAAAAATQPAPTGSLTVQVSSGTAGAAPVVNEAVTVQLYHRGSPLKTIDAKLDDKGVLTLKDLPLMPPVQAMLTFNHNGLRQQAVSPELSPNAPDQTIQVKVYEPTDEQPAWTVAMQHMIVQWDKDGAQVTEMLSVSNPTDRAWMGAKGNGGERVTMTIPISPGAQNVSPGDSLDDASTRLVDGKLVTGSPLFPGRSEFQVTYTVPAQKGALSLTVTTPAQVGNLFVFVPADGAAVKAAGLSGGDAVDTGQGAVRLFKAENLAAGQTATLNVSNLGAAVTTTSGGGFSARNVALGGAFLMVLAGAAMMLLKKPQPKVLKRAV